MEEPYAVMPPVRICAGPPMRLVERLIAVTIYGDPETSAIKNPTPCSVASLLPPRLGVFNSTGPGDL